VQITQQQQGLMVDGSLMRLHVAQPKAQGRYPGVVFFSDIYQLGEPMLRLANRLAGYGYVVAAPEIFHRLERPGTVMEPGGVGRLRGNADAKATPVAAYDADAGAALDWLSEQASVESHQLASFGFCLGGHLALRAALDQRVKAAVCCYPTGLQDGVLGADRADTLERLNQIQAGVFTVFGSLDPHVPPEALQQVLAAFEASGLNHRSMLFEADHTFMRDDGPRWDPQAADEAWSAAMQFLVDQLSGKSRLVSSSASTS